MRANSEESKFTRAWRNIPIIIRAIILGFIISTVGVLSWSLVATLIPMPWSFILMIGLLFIYWNFFNGRWWSPRTKEFRKINFRRVKLPARTMALALLTALLIVLIEQSGLVVTFRLMEFPADRFASEYSFLESVPSWAAWMVVVMISVVAGICEEIGFRGYMQFPMEKKYGPVVSIAIVSVIFVLVHLHQAWSGPILIQVFFISVLFGAIAYSSGSLLPGIAAHVIMDIFNFSFWWTRIGWQFDKETIAVTGIDFHFIGWLFTFLAGIVLFALLLKRLRGQTINN